MSDSESDNEQRLTLEDLENSDAEMLSGDEDSPMDIITSQRVTINNEAALKRLREQVALPTTLAWSETQSVVSSTSVQLEDPDDDLKREMAFYNQALEAAVLGREQINREGGVFTRPEDYFAEMVKSDDHMAKIRQKLLDENASIQASDRARAQRELKKFGKKVQAEKRLEREKAKSDALAKITELKKKRQGGNDDGGDEFDVALESDNDEMKAYKTAGPNAVKNSNNKRGRTSSTSESRTKRHKKDQKFGFGGKKRHGKSNTADSSGDASGFNLKRNNSTSFSSGHKASKSSKSFSSSSAAKKRPGKARRQNAGGRK